MGGRLHGQHWETDEPFEVGDILSWAPGNHLVRTPGPPTPADFGSYVIVDFAAATEDGVEHRRAEPYEG